MENEEDDGAAILASRDEEVNWRERERERERRQGQRPNVARHVAGAGDLLHMGLVKAQEAKVIVQRRNTGMMRVVHRVGRL